MYTLIRVYGSGFISLQTARVAVNLSLLGLALCPSLSLFRSETPPFPRPLGSRQSPSQPSRSLSLVDSPSPSSLESSGSTPAPRLRFSAPTEEELQLQPRLQSSSISILCFNLRLLLHEPNFPFVFCP
ncbi:hypothetical protein PanWU01x14_340420 [Parasponia andersonii]|uniref:Uncharacterized protein n=1 Tax=Parasponia andersonii TaxID=3476 RepID=A0A2P5AED7_PARAD|nr:hypothetical protein PanWU01x14_340420 [Parasponia andersonii]